MMTFGATDGGMTRLEGWMEKRASQLGEKDLDRWLIKKWSGSDGLDLECVKSRRGRGW